MAFAEGNQEVETLATKAAAHSLAYGVRLRGSQRRPQNPYPQIGKTLVNRLREDAAPIMDEEGAGMTARQRFPQLLQCPFPPWDGLWHWCGEFGHETTKTERVRKAVVITTKKSQATMTLAWLRTKVSQRCFGSGVRPGQSLRRYLPTVRGET